MATSEETLDTYKKQMGNELGELFHALAHELQWLHWHWKQYRELYGENPQRIEILNETAPFFFFVVQRVFFEDACLGIAKLIASPKSLGKDNLTIQRLPPLINDPGLRDEVRDLIGKAVNSAAFAVEWRNRYIAHQDLELALNQSAHPLATASRTHVEDALHALRNVLNCVEVALCDSESAYETLAGVRDAESLLYVLRDGIRIEKERQARWAKGEFHKDDYDSDSPL